MPTLNDYQAVAHARNKEELLQGLVNVAEKLDFPLVSGLLLIERPSRPLAGVALSNTPEAYRAASAEKTAAKRDPVLKALRAGNLPIVWNQRTYTAEGAGDLWDLQAPFGYQNGIAVALHLPGARHFLLGIDRPQRLPTRDKELTRLLGDVHLLTVHAQDAAVRLLAPLAQQDPLVQLTPREVEVLRWTMLGKEAKAIAVILGLSVPTVKFHLQNAAAKLGCESKHTAVLRALDYGFLTP